MTKETHKLWGGRFETPTATDMALFNDSFCFDQQLFAADITGSIAWAEALARAKLISLPECTLLIQGLEQIRQEFAEKRFVSQPSDEDIHTAVERRLQELVGAAALKLHTGRSRNDQVATDLRLFCSAAVQNLTQNLLNLQTSLLNQAEKEAQTLMPGYTHLQRAQPITFGHWCLAYVEMFERDRARLKDVLPRIQTLPLGSGALAGNSLGIDRSFLAEKLGFQAVTRNSLDAVADRDFVAELLFICSLIGVHLSRSAEDLILYSSSEFGFIELADEYSTGSSLMPQKKNPDSLELLRGKSGRLIGNLVTMLTVLKGLPLAYNKDMQEDKEPLFDSLATLNIGLRVATAAIATLKVNSQRMVQALDDSMLATDLADELVRNGLPFREAHRKVGQIVRRATELRVNLCDLPLAEYQKIQPDLTDSLFKIFDFVRSVSQKDSFGGTSPQKIVEQIVFWQQKIKENDG